MKNTRILAIVVALIMVLTVFTACGGSSSDTSSTDQESTSDATAQDGEAPIVDFAFFCTAVIPEDIDKVQAAMNDYAMEKVGVGIRLTPLSIGTYNDQINLMITGGEKLDIYNMFAADFSTAVAQSKLYPLTEDLIDEYAPGVKEALGDYMKGTTISGKTYGFGVNKDMAAARGVVLNKNILDKYGYSFTEGQTITYEELSEIFAKVHEGEPDMNMCSSEDVGKSVMDSGLPPIFGPVSKLVRTIFKPPVLSFSQTPV
jgi:putative aldouronate transport system substrate-binding protein